ncbi:hypothetical protein ACFUTR_23235 [Streptomyces sp. NPDC057367]|uniref:hypothetical protein n=1 Tax=Streptomyces sp. NPDC057367 TaxID=3346108 RepID=UPI0036420448
MSQYPVFYAGQRITAGLLSSVLPLEAYKGSDTTRTATTVTADDPDLVLTLEANATYYVEVFIHYAASSSELLLTHWTVPSGATGFRSAWGPAQTVATSDPAGDGRWGIHGFTTDVQYGTRSNATFQTMAWETGNVITTDGGTLALKWAQNTSGATGTRVAAGSYMRAKRIL